MSATVSWVWPPLAANVGSKAPLRTPTLCSRYSILKFQAEQSLIEHYTAAFDDRHWRKIASVQLSGHSCCQSQCTSLQHDPPRLDNVREEYRLRPKAMLITTSTAS